VGGIRGRIAVVIVLSSLAMGQPAIEAGPVPAYQVRESVEQLSVTGAAPGEQIVVERDGPGGPTVLQAVAADALGSALFRGLAPGSGYAVSVGDVTTAGLVVESPPSSQPDQTFYDGQDLVEGFQYLATRDGTELSINVVLPGDIEDVP
jgi:hypothetical protein